MTTFSKLIYRFSAIPTKILANLFAEIDKLILKYLCNCKEPRIDLGKEERRTHTS